MLRLIIGAFLMLATPILADETEHTISVSGRGTVDAVPDIAKVSLGVASDARTAREALGRNSTAMAEVQKILLDQGIEAKDIQTTELSLYPNFENRTPGKAPTVVGYRAQNMVSITVRDIPNLGAILDQVSEAGGNLIQSIQFGINDTTDLMNDARRAAVEDARSKATLYAESAGISVGDVISISEQRGRSPQPMGMARMESMAADVPIASGQLSLSATVNVVFLIE